jgi:hypothetical protein
VRGYVSDEHSHRLVGSTHAAENTVRVLSIARHNDAHVAARTADAGATFARDALRDWRPSSDQWPMRFVMGSDPFRDESIAQTTFVVGLQYLVRSSI